MEELIKFHVPQMSKASAEEIKNDISNKLQEGEIDPIWVMASMKFYEKVFESLNPIIKGYVLDELEKDKLRNEYFGFKVEVRESGVRYDFSNCNHPGLNDLYEQHEEIKTKIAEIEKFLKSIPQGKYVTILNEETGEIIQVKAPARFSTTSPVFKL